MYVRSTASRCALVSFVFLAAAVRAAPAEEAPAATVTCASAAGERQHCPADTSGGVALARTIGPAPCLLGKTWGYDDTGVWVTDGCNAEFTLGQSVSEAAAPSVPAPVVRAKPSERIESWGDFSPGEGFLIGRNKHGELSISAYALVRYVNQLPADQTFTDHLGNEHDVDTRQDIFPHRAMVFFKGWVGRPELVYNIVLWTVNTTDQDAIFGNIGYQFNKNISLYGGINGLPGTRSLQGSHPYWLGHDRVMADEFFRSYFTFGVWAQGEPVPGLWYNVMVGNNLSSLGVTASQLDRDLGTGASVWWMPTTHEFGPRGAYGDWEMHDKVATRFGISTAESLEQRTTDAATGAPDNTTLKLADSLNVFDTGALATAVTVEEADYRLLAVDAGMKYRGFFAQAEFYMRWLDDFQADGAVPVEEIVDKGFYVQAAFYPVPKKLELYAATSQIYGDRDAGFDDSSEYLVGLNFYLADTRDHRLNLQVVDVNRSPVSSTFGYYVGGQDGTIVSLGCSVFF